MPDLHILPTSDDVAREAAEFVAELAERRTHTQDFFTVALAGGSTPSNLYQLLGSPPYTGRIDWDRWQVFWGDERCVPPDHRDSNYRMAREALLDRVPIPADRIHRMKGEAAPHDAAEEYEQELLDVFRSGRPVFDLILLGIGEDGHTASLFPGTDALDEKRRQVVANWVPHLRAYRVTFTLPLINDAGTVAFLVTEESKAGVLGEVLQYPSRVPEPPSALVCPVSGRVHWFLTRAAASRLGDIGA